MLSSCSLGPDMWIALRGVTGGGLLHSVPHNRPISPFLMPQVREFMSQYGEVVHVGLSRDDAELVACMRSIKNLRYKVRGRGHPRCLSSPMCMWGIRSTSCAFLSTQSR